MLNKNKEEVLGFSYFEVDYNWILELIVLYIIHYILLKKIIIKKI